MLKTRIRYLSRYQDIITALYHYGFGQIVRDLGLLDRTKKRTKKTCPRLFAFGRQADSPAFRRAWPYFH